MRQGTTVPSGLICGGPSRSSLKRIIATRARLWYVALVSLIWARVTSSMKFSRLSSEVSGIPFARCREKPIPLISRTLFHRHQLVGFVLREIDVSHRTSFPAFTFVSSVREWVEARRLQGTLPHGPKHAPCDHDAP